MPAIRFSCCFLLFAEARSPFPHQFQSKQVPSAFTPSKPKFPFCDNAAGTACVVTKDRRGTPALRPRPLRPYVPLRSGPSGSASAETCSDLLSSIPLRFISLRAFAQYREKEMIICRYLCMLLSFSRCRSHLNHMAIPPSTLSTCPVI